MVESHSEECSLTWLAVVWEVMEGWCGNEVVAVVCVCVSLSEVRLVNSPLEDWKYC